MWLIVDFGSSIDYRDDRQIKWKEHREEAAQRKSNQRVPLAPKC